MANLTGPEFDTPSIKAAEATIVFHSRTVINAPASMVFRSLRNTETWKDWNRWVPKVTITHQPAEEDTATAAEIAEIVRNTSILGSFDSDLTDGGVTGATRPTTADDVPPPRVRLGSMDSRMSSSSSQGGQGPTAPAPVPGPLDTLAALEAESAGAQAVVGNPGTVSATNGQPKKSAAQRFQEAQDARRASIARGESPPPVRNSLQSDRRSSLQAPSSADPNRRLSRVSQASTDSITKARWKAQQRTKEALINMYGEPDVRLRIGTKLTFHVRMEPYSPSKFTDSQVTIRDISRPDDPVFEPETTALTRSKTHNLDRSGIYRLTWTTNSERASLINLSGIFSGTKIPKSMLYAERCHEIVPQTDGKGDEICVYRTWECMRGPLAKVVKKKQGDYIQKMFEVWVEGLKDFCEGLHAPKVAVRDFSISVER